MRKQEREGQEREHDAERQEDDIDVDCAVGVAGRRKNQAEERRP